MDVVVVIPARNEADQIGKCLDAIRAAQDKHRSRDPLFVASVIVVADRCDDATELIARRAGAQVVSCRHGLVGAARRMGADHALHHRQPGRTWIACTDADSQVPDDWFYTHFDAARRGVGLLLGTVRPDPAELPPEALQDWLSRHDLRDGHPHVHGANLGIRGDVYVSAGGFPAAAVHEDVVLAARVRALGLPVEATGRSPVATSARLAGRTPAGFAGYLRTQLTPVR